MLKFTLDTMCVYDLDDESRADPIQHLAESARLGRIVLQVPAMAASERQRLGGRVEDFGQFRERLARVGLDGATLLRPMGYFDLCYYDWFVYTGSESEAEELKIHEILFPEIASDADAHCPVDDEDGRRKWRNAKCDVQAMWCHIHYRGDVFVTRDDNFLKSKKSRLEALGAGLIVAPEAAVTLLP